MNNIGVIIGDSVTQSDIDELKNFIRDNKIQFMFIYSETKNFDIIYGTSTDILIELQSLCPSKTSISKAEWKRVIHNYKVYLLGEINSVIEELLNEITNECCCNNN